MINRKITMLAVILLLFSLIFSGCTVNGKKNYKKKDVTQYLNTRFSKKEYRLSKQEKQEWQMKLVDFDELDFNIYAVKESYKSEWGSVTTYYLYEDIEYLLALHYLEQYGREHPDEYQKLAATMTIDSEPIYYDKRAVVDKDIFVKGAHLRLKFTFGNRSEMVDIIDKLGRLIEYLDQQPNLVGVNIQLIADMELDSKSDAIMKVFSNGVSFPEVYYANEREYLVYDREKLINRWDYRMAVAYARWRAGPEEYSIAEISELLENGSERQYILTVERADGSITRWSDLLYYYKGISINVLQEVLRREGITVEAGIGEVKVEERDGPVMFSIGDTLVYLDEEGMTYVVDGMVVAYFPLEEEDDDFDLEWFDEADEDMETVEEVYYSYLLWSDSDGNTHLIREYNDDEYRFEYMRNGEKIDSGDSPVISFDLFQAITGLRRYEE